MYRKNATYQKRLISLPTSKSSILIGKNKLQIERIKDASKESYSDFSIFNGTLLFKECQVFSL